MATKHYYLSGTAKWAKLRKPDEKYNNFQLPLYLDDKSFKLFKDIGLGLKIREDEDGTFITLKRPVSKLIKNEVVEFGPPKVFNADNTEFDGLVGNGSEVTAKICVYDTIKGPGHRLESVRVEKLVEYNPTAAAGTEGNAATGGPALPF